jgi:hypothetical protein
MGSQTHDTTVTLCDAADQSTADAGAPTECETKLSHLTGSCTCDPCTPATSGC